ncbi:stage II sporulation protein E [Polycladomyces sp. WAk]|uniref:Stage II sporulation protein E n=1 Tax=Polycladomyces zharkentensis TaxID=2807616 RepID=A0ABS2WM98_9BACL|nr:stage II sporulation protein E [Polycladomyces sp. WAk]MBN2910654.1 stage II sporulation protein E [Polycladomyces sp. WAk]
MQMRWMDVGMTWMRPIGKAFRLSPDTKQKLRRWSRVWNLPLMLMGFLFGRAVMLDAVSPFSVAYLAVVYQLSRRQWPAVAVALMAGAATREPVHTAQTAAGLILFLVIQKIFAWVKRGQINYVPFVVLTTSAGVHLLRFWWSGWTPYQAMMAGIDVLLSFILSFIFVQSLPFFTVRRKRMALRQDEMICLVILIGSVMTGAMGWAAAGVSAVHVLSRYVILVLALVGGGMTGAAVGVVNGMILSLSDPRSLGEISLLAFAGLLAGLFREGKRWGVTVGFILGTAILSLYAGGKWHAWISLAESASAIVLLWLTPSAFFKVISRHIPGTDEYQHSQQEYVRRLRDVTAAKVDQFTELFVELARSFREDPGLQRQQETAHFSRFLGDVTEKTCKSCHRYRQCWERDMMKTYQGMTDLMAMVEMHPKDRQLRTPRSWSEHCVKADKVLALIQERYDLYEHDLYWREQVREARRLVSEQLEGVAGVMRDLAEDIRREAQVLAAQEEQIQLALEELGLSIQRVEVISLEEGKVEIEVTLPHGDALDECRKLIAPLLTEIIGEPIAVYRKVIQGRTSGTVVTLGSAQRYEIKTGVAGAAKGGHWLSGDSYCYMNLGTGKYAVALSDGMGNGQRAQEESHAALGLLRRLLQAGMDEKKAVETVNAILGLRSTDEMFATIDLAIIDLKDANTRFLKIGSTPGFIKRGKEVITLSAGNPPIGILRNIDVEPLEKQLQPGDLLIMVTDGVLDAPRHAHNKELHLKRLIAEIDTKDPQSFADCLLEQVVRGNGGNIDDDMTVVVSKVDHYTPEWATIRLSGVSRVERPQAAAF